ncbi:MAG TPA: hypothetical protein VFN87_14325 [Solirubrobacteraceae bacterium]|nr:hypothetical protein [Solirubrobacteraceae bacterium]
MGVRDHAAYGVLLVLGLVLIVAGIRGQLGAMVAAILAPAALAPNQ